MASRIIKIDPDGDTLVILPKKGLANGIFSHDGGGSDLGTTQPELHYLCSKKHLATASRRACKMFASGFAEATPDPTDNLHHWRFEPIFDPEAFEIVLKAIHAKIRDIPTFVDTQLFAGIAAIADDLECHDALWFFAKTWLTTIKASVPTVMCSDISRFILISFVFDDPVIFETSTKTAITSSSSSNQVSLLGLPIRPSILDEIEQKRQDLLEKLINDLQNLESQLIRKKLGCSSGCSAMLLGTLVQGMESCSLYFPRPSRPFPGLYLRSTIASLRKLQSPKYYDSIENSPAGRYSGLWRVEQYPHGISGKPYYGASIYQNDNALKLVQHNCSLTNHVQPILDAIETAFHGLELSKHSSFGRK
ncbi:hypothetical protein B0I35DRAFT_441864 [Stachybotrys elegans]|uniref:BTB domain-containing protein n=1 Tax=Stachybotrys elegans TaxID=80388 RepID=A0A8K0WMT3_9HYPO|nr:hypothetical protein B0I35DRAFT_441864 [Stachybotrys elegans]